MTADLALVAISAIVIGFIIGQHLRERRDEKAAAIREDAINEADYDAMSDTPLYDDIALARLRAGLADWGRDL